jgi:hypothetical protein
MAEDDAFEDLVSNCIEAYGITYSDSVALNANGVVGKMRVLILENTRYQRETRRLKARRTMDELKEVNELLAGIDAEPEADESEAASEEVIPDEDPDYDIRNKNSKKKSKKIPKEIEKVKKATAKSIKSGGFDKSKIDTRLKLIQERREILNADGEEEEKTKESINIFFVAVTAEEFAAIETVEVSESTSSTADFDKADNGAVKTALGSAVLKESKNSRAFHYEGEGEDKTLVED